MYKGRSEGKGHREYAGHGIECAIALVHIINVIILNSGAIILGMSQMPEELDKRLQVNIMILPVDEGMVHFKFASV